MLLVAAVLAIAGTAVAGLPTTVIDGRPYIELTRVAATVNGALDASPSSPRAYLRTEGHVVTLTRNWAQLLVDIPVEDHVEPGGRVRMSRYRVGPRLRPRSAR